MQFNLPEAVLTAIGLLNNAGYEAFVVGGSVRNALLELPIYDYDMTTSATPEEMKEVFKNYKIIETGIKHGTLTIHINHLALEITTYRIESDYADHRHPNSVSFSRNLKDDLERRDFTINALAYHPNHGVIDYFNGIEDLNNHIIRAINDPMKRFDEDALRIMRALRFSSTLNFAIDSQTAKAIHESKELLTMISKERIHDELLKLLIGDNVYEILIEYPDILEIIIPELAPMVNCHHENPHHIYDIYTHSAHAVSNTPNDSLLRMAALLHDIGKPYVKAYDNFKIAHYQKHAEKSVELAGKILNRLKFSNKDIKIILTLITHHDEYMIPNRIQIKKVLALIGKELTYQLLELQIADNKAKSKLYDRQKEYHEVRITLDDIIQKEECFSIKMLAINGNDVLSLGVKPTMITSILNTCLNEVIEEHIENTKESLINFVTHNLI